MRPPDEPAPAHRLPLQRIDYSCHEGSRLRTRHVRYVEEPQQRSPADRASDLNESGIASDGSRIDGAGPIDALLK